MPSIAEAYGLVFCEANAYGVPCLSTSTGGIPAIVQNDVNGFLFAQEAAAADFAEYILAAVTPGRYRQLACGALTTYKGKLNWAASGAKMKMLIDRIVSKFAEPDAPTTSTGLVTAAR